MFKGLTLSILIVVFLLVGPAYIMAFTSNSYSSQCKMSVAVPCVGILNE